MVGSTVGSNRHGGNRELIGTEKDPSVGANLIYNYERSWTIVRPTVGTNTCDRREIEQTVGAADSIEELSETSHYRLVENNMLVSTAFYV